MANRVLILTGAPESHTLDWDSGELLSDFQDAIARFAGISTSNALPRVESSAPEHAAWRVLPLDKASVPAYFTQQDGHALNYGTTPEFLSTASLSFASDSDAAHLTPALSQFYEHSLAAHQDFTSSQLLLSQSGALDTSFASDGTTSFLSDLGTQPDAAREPLSVQGSGALSDLERIPSAAYLAKIQPQTMTCNLIVGIISISRPRAIKTRWGATKHLVEMLVGDETKAGFAVTYWLPSDSVADSPLAGLRPQDIVLMQNVALNVFNQKVYGSSLRKDLTKVHLLYRLKLDAADAAGHYSTSDLSSKKGAHPQLEKTRRVRDWVLNFVGQGSHHDRARTKRDSRPRWDRPPTDDTQLA